MINRALVIKMLLLIGHVYIWSSCNSYTEERVDKREKLLLNKKRLSVEKINKETTNVGIFTNHNYGTSHSFTYKLSIQPEGIHWDGGSGEPKHLLFCNDTIYIHYFKEKRIQIEYTDSIDSVMKTKYHFEIREVFQKHIDERYFFKIFGEDFWIDITPEDYAYRKEFCKEYDIPNDGELLLKSNLKD
ncbi:hypothetical protein [Aquimarina muelleri]|uniref:Lipoprotein n=2 Tax=Aquimarina muelleri TaxID=279356 RepID=A0A918JWP8_9FLAO|nr:hypothetical protein [Aquimarina muelleri]GGX23149.1 hypothetical protein GCM10007384_25450 [Aquimarina muelleri]